MCNSTSVIPLKRGINVGWTHQAYKLVLKTRLLKIHNSFFQLLLTLISLFRGMTIFKN
ncbi:MAG: hypothetical protein V4642_00815 [Bacteroidota bacterium]